MMADVQQIFASALITAAAHPVQYAKVLIQVGHEPISPEPCKTLFGKKALCYPNVFKYIGHIKKQDGFLGLYRGLGASIGANFMGNMVSNSVTKYFHPVDEKDLCNELDGDNDVMEQVKNFAEETSKDCLARCAGVVASHPLRVIMLRSMVQFVGQDTAYNSICSSIKDIYREDGILGFFAGLVPRLLGEVISIWLASLLANIIAQFAPKNHPVKSYSGAACSLMVTQFTYPFHLVSTVMACNVPSLTAGRPPHMSDYSSWMQCWNQLSTKGDLKRGSSMFFRYYKGPVMLVNGQLAPASLAF